MEVEEWNETASFDFAMNNFLNNFPADEAGVVREVLANVAERIFSDLNEGDLKYNVDFKNVYATVLNKWLGADDKMILGNKFEKLNFI